MKRVTKAAILGTRAMWLLSGVAGLLLLTGCDRPILPQQRAGWTVYQNERYDFQFPRPRNWQPVLMPSNQDGEAFADPRDAEVQIRGWASQIRLPPDQVGGTFSQTRPPASGVNYTTEQGLAALLQVDVGEEISSMRLTLTLNGVEYNWEGRSPSDQFAEYYPLFNYIVSQYQIQN